MAQRCYHVSGKTYQGRVYCALCGRFIRETLRESEGWTSTLATLLSPPPEEEEEEVCGCLMCLSMEDSSCKYEQYHGPGSVCNFCGYIGQIVL